MARRIQTNPIANPQLLGVELVDVVVGAAGLAGTAYVNDKLVAPLTKRVLPSLYASEFVAKVVDAGTTLLSAWALAQVVDILTPAHIARQVLAGGGILAGGRLISAVVPGFQISASVPASLDILKLPGVAAAPAPQPQQPTALPEASGLQTQQMLGIGTTGL